MEVNSTSPIYDHFDSFLSRCPDAEWSRRGKTRQWLQDGGSLRSSAEVKGRRVLKPELRNSSLSLYPSFSTSLSLYTSTSFSTSTPRPLSLPLFLSTPLPLSLPLYPSTSLSSPLPRPLSLPLFLSLSLSLLWGMRSGPHLCVAVAPRRAAATRRGVSDQRWNASNAARGNCECVWAEWFQMFLWRFHREQQLLSVAMDTTERVLEKQLLFIRVHHGDQWCPGL